MSGLSRKNPRHVRLIAWLNAHDAICLVSFRDGVNWWHLYSAGGMTFVVSVDHLGGWNVYTGLAVNDVGASLLDAEKRLNLPTAEEIAGLPSRLAKCDESAMGPYRRDDHYLEIPPRHGKTARGLLETLGHEPSAHLPRATPIDGSTPACIAPEYACCSVGDRIARGISSPNSEHRLMCPGPTTAVEHDERDVIAPAGGWRPSDAAPAITVGNPEPDDQVKCARCGWGMVRGTRPGEVCTVCAREARLEGIR